MQYKTVKMSYWKQEYANLRINDDTKRNKADLFL